eukprot:CAMPEP_0172527070 /NCGR_PEP_ID=MMETSP1067-20121228/1847_1 /TAXON_ID=265564 ORGANISM="Thalassiosira punctigera, Strain Tpunct2005C2" /NCGR_SAMPLE_ID=MMETSP1067 /ASSEMBLY_ACC=CAM_ASM_000444 /LENGTH=706 /DNA_ID=CAMNT_0013310735 /DNA_START=177 /DNA_END=2297 /DNA_ORIENTATION=+
MPSTPAAAFSFYAKSAAACVPVQSSINTLPLPLVRIPNTNDLLASSDALSRHHHAKFDPIRIDLTDEEEDLFDLLRTVTADTGMKSTLRVAGGWVRDKILASDEFRRLHAKDGLDEEGTKQSATATKAKSKEEDLELTRQAIMTSSASFLSVTEHVDIDIALDDRLGREFADELNSWLASRGRESHTVGVVLKNPEKSKHLETATMRINNYWIDFVNLRAEEYATDSRIPELMRIGTPLEDAMRRDLTINSLFYNINEDRVEDMTGRGLDDLRKGVVDTPLPPLTTLLDDPLRVLRSVRFAARLRFGVADALREAAADPRVRGALEQKVSRERVGSEVDLMLKSRDPVRALRLLVNLGLIDTVFPKPNRNEEESHRLRGTYHEGLALLGTTHDHLCDCMANRPRWCEAKRALEAGALHGLGRDETLPLMEDEEARRLLWYAAFLKPLRDRSDDSVSGQEEEVRKKPRKAKKKSTVTKLLVDELKRPTREAESIEAIMKAADEFTALVFTGGSESALAILLSGACVINSARSKKQQTICTIENRDVDPDTERDPVWEHCMEFRRDCADVLKRVEHRWRAAFILSLSEQLVNWQNHKIEYVCDVESSELGSSSSSFQEETPEEILCSIMKKYDLIAAAMLQMGLIGIWKQRPLLDGGEIKSESVLPNLPHGPEFRSIMDAQMQWMITHPGGSRESLVKYLNEEFPNYR